MHKSMKKKTAKLALRQPYVWSVSDIIFSGSAY